MSPEERDLGAYARTYEDLPFEDLQADRRRRLVLERVRLQDAAVLVEVGCGSRPLFLDLPADTVVTVVEPAPAFAEAARRAAEHRRGVTVVSRPGEDVGPADLPARPGMVVVSGLLHEVADPQRLLAAVRSWCARDTVVHVNVPNAGSLHRLLAVAMGLTGSPQEESATQRLLQQQRVYDEASLDAELAAAGLRVTARGSILVKPFTHAQMQQLVDTGFLTDRMLDGLDRLARDLPELGSEIWVDAEPAGA